MPSEIQGQQEDLHQCRWVNCNASPFINSIQLYEHITREHIGRKASNNLCLKCHWESCRFEAKKRDHITSHMRSHIDYRPHLCRVCQKTFKRPQDLKKHEKTHTEQAAATSHGPTPVTSLSPEYYSLYPGAGSSPGATTYLHPGPSAASPSHFPDSPNSLNGFVPDLSPDHRLPSTGLGVSDVSDNESYLHPHPPFEMNQGVKRGRGALDELLDDNNRVKVQATYTQETQSVLNRLMRDHSDTLVSLESDPSLNLDNLQDLYRFFQEVYENTASVDVSEALNANPVPLTSASTATVGKQQMVDPSMLPNDLLCDSNLSIDVTPDTSNNATMTSAAMPAVSLAAPALTNMPTTMLPTATSAGQFDITVQPFDESQYTPLYPTQVTMVQANGQYINHPVVGPVSMNGMVTATPTNAHPLATTSPVYQGLMPGALPSLHPQPLLTTKGYVAQALPVATVGTTSQPAYQVYTLLPQMKAREESVDPEVVENVFREVIHDDQVIPMAHSPLQSTTVSHDDDEVPTLVVLPGDQSDAEPLSTKQAEGEDEVNKEHARLSSNQENGRSTPVLETTPSPVLSSSPISLPDTVDPAQLERSTSPREPSPLVDTGLNPRSPRLLSPRRVESVSVCAPSTLKEHGSARVTRSFMYPVRPYNKRISMTEGCEDDFVDISQQVIQPRSGIRSKSLAHEGGASLAPITEQPSTRNAHAAFAATMLGRLYELMSRCHTSRTADSLCSPQVTPANHGANAADVSEPTVKDDEADTGDYVTLSKEECLMEDHTRRTSSASNEVTGDLLARFHKLALGSRTGTKLTASPPSMHSVSLPFDITVAPE